MNAMGTRISTSWKKQREVVKLSLIIVSNVALGLAGIQLLQMSTYMGEVVPEG